jgi:hypothetical protein
LSESGLTIKPLVKNLFSIVRRQRNGQKEKEKEGNRGEVTQEKNKKEEKSD